MKKILFLIFASFLSSLLAQVSFEFKCLDDTFRLLPPNGWADYRFTLKNLSPLPDSYELKILVIESVPGWAAQICARGRCVEPGVPLFLTLAPNEVDTTISAHIYTNPNPGREKVFVSCLSLTDTTQRAGYNIYAQVGSGISEFLIPNPKFYSSSFTSDLRPPGSKFSFSLLGSRLNGKEGSGGVYFLLPDKKKVVSFR